MKESGPDSTVKPSILSVLIAPPIRSFASNTVTSMGPAAAPHSWIRWAAASPKSPLPITTTRSRFPDAGKRSINVVISLSVVKSTTPDIRADPGSVPIITSRRELCMQKKEMSGDIPACGWFGECV